MNPTQIIAIIILIIFLILGIFKGTREKITYSGLDLILYIFCILVISVVIGNERDTGIINNICDTTLEILSTFMII